MWHLRFVVAGKIQYVLGRDKWALEFIRDSITVDGAQDAKIYPFAEPPEDYQKFYKEKEKV